MPLPTVSPSERSFNPQTVCVWETGLFIARWYNPSVPANEHEVIALAAGVVGSAPIIPALGRWRGALGDRWRAIGLDAISTTALMLILVAAIMQMAARTYNPFIYFRF